MKSIENKKHVEINDNLKEKIKKLQEKLFGLWDKCNIPNHHREIFIENFKGIKREELNEIVEIEISKLEKKTSLIQVKTKYF